MRRSRQKPQGSLRAGDIRAPGLRIQSVPWHVRWWLPGSGSGRPSGGSPPSVALGSSRGSRREATVPRGAAGAGGARVLGGAPLTCGLLWFLAGSWEAGVGGRTSRVRSSRLRNCGFPEQRPRRSPRGLESVFPRGSAGGPKEPSRSPEKGSG